MGLLILFGRIGDRGGLPIARIKTPNLKASCQVLPGGLEKIPHILGIFFYLVPSTLCFSAAVGLVDHLLGTNDLTIRNTYEGNRCHFGKASN